MNIDAKRLEAFYLLCHRMHVSENVTYAASSTCCLLCRMQEMQTGYEIDENVCAYALLDSAAVYDDGVLSHADQGKDLLCGANN